MKNQKITSALRQRESTYGILFLLDEEKILAVSNDPPFSYFVFFGHFFRPKEEQRPVLHNFSDGYTHNETVFQMKKSFSFLLIWSIGVILVHLYEDPGGYNHHYH